MELVIILLPGITCIVMSRVVVVGEDSSRAPKRPRQTGDHQAVVGVVGQGNTVVVTGAAVAQQLGHFDLAGEGATLARTDALQALDTMKKWASDSESYNAFSVYFQRYAGPARMLDFLKENMEDAKLVELICSFFNDCMYTDNDAAEDREAIVMEFRKLFVDVDGIETFLLANIEHFTNDTDLGVMAAQNIWSCLSNVTSLYPDTNDGSIAREKEQTTLVTEAGYDWLEKLGSTSDISLSRMNLLDSILGTLSFQMDKSILKNSHVKTKKIVPTALKAVLLTIGKWNSSAVSSPGGICAFFGGCSDQKNLLTPSQFQELLPMYVEALKEYPLETCVTTFSIAFLENASSVLEGIVMKKAGVCVALSQFDISDAAEDCWKERARTLVKELYE